MFRTMRLKDHQLVGLNWMVLLNKHNINGILADEMGFAIPQCET